MRNKATLVLIEQLVMVLVFALAAAICLQAFVRAEQISRQTELRTEAAFAAQNAAEMLQIHKDIDKTIDVLGGQNGHVEYDAFSLSVASAETSIDGLESAKIEVFDMDQQLLFSIHTAWQTEVAR